MKVIFLDVDGVLNSNDYIEYTSKNNVKGILEEIDPKKIDMLKQVLNITGAKMWCHRHGEISVNLKN